MTRAKSINSYQKSVFATTRSLYFHSPNGGLRSQKGGVPFTIVNASELPIVTGLGFIKDYLIPELSGISGQLEFIDCGQLTFCFDKSSTSSLF